MAADKKPRALKDIPMGESIASGDNGEIISGQELKDADRARAKEAKKAELAEIRRTAPPVELPDFMQLEPGYTPKQDRKSRIDSLESQSNNMKKGGAVKKFSRGGGIEVRGKTKGRFV